MSRKRSWRAISRAASKLVESAVCSMPCSLVERPELMSIDTNASVGRYYSKGIAKVLVPLDQLDQALSQDTSSISHGRKCRVAKWAAKAPSPRAHGHQAGRGREILSAAYIASEDSLMKGRARFVAEFLAAQNPGDGLQKSSLRGQRLYSQVASEKTTEMRIKSMEIAMRDMMRLLRSTVK